MIMFFLIYFLIALIVFFASLKPIQTYAIKNAGIIDWEREDTKYLLYVTAGLSLAWPLFIPVSLISFVVIKINKYLKILQRIDDMGKAKSAAIYEKIDQ